MDTAAPSLVLALAAGLASFLSPCVLPLVPAYIGYLSGHVVTTTGEQPALAQRFVTFSHALAFVIGFSAVFVALGAAAGWLGNLLRSDWVRWIGGLVMVFFGLTLMGWIRLPALEAERRIHVRRRPGLGHLSSLLVGVSFAAGWTPCFGPVLGGILALGVQQGDVARSTLLLVAYSVGLGVPFLLVGLAIDRMSVLLGRLQRHLRPIQIAAGVVLVVLGALLFTDQLRAIGEWMTDWGIGWDLGL